MYGWYRSEANEKPLTVDKDSSKQYVYIRKNIKEETRPMEDGETQTVYTYLECLIPKDVFVIYESQANADNRLDDIEEVITEIIGGGL